MEDRVGPRRRPRLTRVQEQPDRRLLSQFTTVEWRDVRETALTALERGTADRNLQPAISFGTWFPTGGRVAVLGAAIETPDDLVLLTRFVLDPAYRAGCDLLVWASRLPNEVPPGPIVADEGFGLTRARFDYLVDRYWVRPTSDGLPPMTPIEEQLHEAMRQLDLQPLIGFTVEPYVLDFAFTGQRIAVEADGREWHDAVRDADRDAELRDRGWTVLRFTGSEIYADAEGCARRVAAELERARPQPVYTAPMDVEDLPWWRRILDWLRSLFMRERPVIEITTRPVAVTDRAELDIDQRQAVAASDGVTQVIAPAGSGKTTVLIARVQELIARGVPPHRILCTTFNKAASEELRDRLDAVGVPRSVGVRTFHSLGLKILRDEGLLAGELVQLAHGEWRKITGRIANDPDTEFLDAPEAQEWVSHFKLVDLARPNELSTPPVSSEERTARRVYTAYQQELERRRGWDFDDLIFKAARALRDDEQLRHRWQQTWWCVLVDEYQDIEPAQELLIRTVAAPQECMFVVGDEDQCIYAWRRAEVERIVRLEDHYPSLDRIVLQTNYRCGTDIVAAADRLVQHNLLRFPKQIWPGRDIAGEISAKPASDSAEIAKALSEVDAAPGATAVLSRTTAELREVALACIDRSLPITASEQVLRPTNAERVVLALFRITHAPENANESDVLTAFRYPNRYLPNELAGRVLKSLRSGASFTETMSRLPEMAAWRIVKLQDVAPLLDRLTKSTGALDAIQFMRGPLGLDEHFASRDQTSPTDHADRDALDQLEKLVQGRAARTIAKFIDDLDERRRRLQEAATSEGIELTTIHGAKGREWETVFLVGADAKLMPHHKSLLDSEDLEAQQRAMEDERRLAYVALTRAKDSLSVRWSEEPSPFLFEARILDGPAPPIARPKPSASIGPSGPTTVPGQPPHSGPPPFDIPQPRRTSPEAAESTGPYTSSSPAKRVGSKKAVRAKFAAQCLSCKKDIAIGELITHDGRGWVHESCNSGASPTG